MIKRDRLAFMQDWNDLRKENEEFVIKHSAEKMEQQTVDKLKESQTGDGFGVPKEEGKVEEFEDTKKIEMGETVNLNQFKKEREKVVRDTESEYERNDGISKVVVDQLEEKLIAKIETLDQKINNLNV